MNHAQLKQLLEDQAAAAQAQRGNAVAKMRLAIFVRLAATVSAVPHGRLSELGELMRLAPATFNRFLGQVGTTSFMPRHCNEFVSGMISRLRPQEDSSDMYLPRYYREILER